jgi:hypothetical protein
VLLASLCRQRQTAQPAQTISSSGLRGASCCNEMCSTFCRMRSWVQRRLARRAGFCYCAGCAHELLCRMLTRAVSKACSAAQQLQGALLPIGYSTAPTWPLSELASLDLLLPSSSVLGPQPAGFGCGFSLSSRDGSGCGSVLKPQGFTNGRDLLGCQASAHQT